MNDTRVYVVDDDRTIRASLSWLLESVGLTVATYATQQEFLAGYDPDRPGCLLLDVRMPGISGLEFNRYLKAHRYRVPVIFITGHGDVPMCATAMREGAVDFLEKPFHSQSMIESVTRALDRDTGELATLVRRRDAAERVDSLSAREREILDLMLGGAPSKAIASRLSISPKTVEVHRARVRQKLRTDNPVAMAGLVRDAAGDRSAWAGADVGRPGLP